MTFPETLRELAQLRPEKFLLIPEKLENESYARFRWIEGDQKKEFEMNVDWMVTQDDIDSIMAELGWEYWVIPESMVDYFTDDKGKIMRWHAEVRKFDGFDQFVVQCRQLDKLSAARAALTAVVEELKGEKKP